MVIVCPECSTKFRVNPERIPDSGAKVRCARCKHVFVAEKPPLEDGPLPVPVTPQPTEEPDHGTAEASEAATREDRAGIETIAGENPTENSGFSYDQFRNLDASESSTEDFTFGADGTEEALDREISEPESQLDEEETFSFSSPADDNPADVAEVAAEAELPVAETTDEAPEVGPEENTDGPAAAADPVEKTEPEVVEAPTVSEKSGSSFGRILLLLILGLLIIGGAVYYINGPEPIQQMIQQLLGQQTEDEDSGQIMLTGLEGKFITNSDAGELFVIRGQATNTYKEPRSGIQVKGVIFDQNGKPLLQKTIYCGNSINDQELQTLPFSKLEEMMRNQFGKSLNNLKVNSNEAIPFVIAFRDLPGNLAEFSVDVTSSEPANK